MKINNLLDSTCEACRVDAPKVTEEEIKELKPLVPSWEIIENNQLRKLICSFAFSSYKEGVSFATYLKVLISSQALVMFSQTKQLKPSR